MSSDDKKHDDQEGVAQVVQGVNEFDDDPAEGGGYTMGEDPGFDTDVMEAEEVYEDPQEEGHDGGEADDFAEDAPAGNKNMKKMLAPALVLVCALGIGAYIMMNPGLIAGGSAGAPSVQQPAPDVPQQVAVVSPPPPLLPIEIAAAAAAAAAPVEEMPPQPVALEQVQGSDAALPPLPSPPQENAGGFGDPVVSAPPAAEPSVVPAVDVTEGLGTPPAEPPEMEIAGIPAAPPPVVPDVPSFVPENSAVPPETAAAAPPAPETFADEKTVAESAGVSPVSPVIPEIPVEEIPAASAEPPPMVDEFPQIAVSPGKQGVAQIPGLEGGGAEEGIVGKGAPATQETVLTPMEDKPAPVAPGEDNYFDSKMTVPTNQAAKDTGPRKVDPVMEPGSKFVVVNKTYNAQSQESLMISANRALKLGRYEAAIEMYDSLYSRNPKDPAILLGRAVSYQKAGRADSALKIYDELLAVDKGNENALLNMLGLLREQYPEVALRRLMNLHEQYPGNAGIAAQIGLTEADLRHYGEALRYLGMAASIEPRNAQHLFNMGIVADRKGDKAQAIKFYEQALEADAVYGGGRSVPREQIYDRLSALRRG